jgi:hypothetical protein
VKFIKGRRHLEFIVDSLQIAVCGDQGMLCYKFVSKAGRRGLALGFLGDAREARYSSRRISPGVIAGFIGEFLSADFADFHRLKVFKHCFKSSA